MTDKRYTYQLTLSCLFLIFILLCQTAFAQTTSFTYQGKLSDNSNPANGNYDLRFTLWDAASGGIQQPQPAPITLTRNNVPVTNGIFNVQLDFTVNAFPGADRFLEISVRSAGVGTFATLSTRQQISSTPYAIRTLSAATADAATNATQLGGVAASQYVQTTDSRLSDARSPTAGSSNYIQNNPPSQQAASFNISGNGTASTLKGNVIDATSQYNINGSRLLSTPGANNLFAGLNAGASNTSGVGNVFVGTGAGQANTTSSNNSYLGFNAGLSNSTTLVSHNENSFFGANAGKTILGSRNSFFGSNAAGNGGQGNDNAFFGASAGSNNNASNNAFFGSGAGQANTTGDSNAFFGTAAGSLNSFASFNAFFGSGAGQANTGGSNSFFGANAGLNNTASGNSFFGIRAGFANTTGTGNSFFGGQTGQANTVQHDNTSLATMPE